MQSEIERLMEEMRTNKEQNHEFYSQVLKADYGNGDYRLPSPNTKLIKQKDEGHKSKLRHSMKMTFDYIDPQTVKMSMTNPDLMKQGKKYKVNHHLEPNVNLA